jgi:mevalonate kinase
MPEVEKLSEILKFNSSVTIAIKITGGGGGSISCCCCKQRQQL